MRRVPAARGGPAPAAAKNGGPEHPQLSLYRRKARESDPFGKIRTKKAAEHGSAFCGGNLMGGRLLTVYLVLLGAGYLLVMALLDRK